MRRRFIALVTVAAALTVAACGADNDDGATATTASETTAAAVTTTPDTTTPATTPETATPDTTAVSGASFGDPEAGAAALAWTTVFDSTLGFDAKAAHIAEAEALQPTIEAYTAAGEAVGGIALQPTEVVVTGDTAAITYDVTFAGQPAYQDQDGTIARVAGVWQVSREEFCGFMSAARNPCPA